MITLKDVAIKAGVSEATASLAMNNKKTVNAETRKKVLEVAAAMGYIPNSIARGLARSKTNTIGLIVTDVQNPYFGGIIGYIDEYLRLEQYNFILSVSNDDLLKESQIIESFIRQRVDGVIIIPAQSPRADFLSFNQLDLNKIPYVFSTTYDEGWESHAVMTDLTKGSYLLTKYLLGLGHRSIMVLVSSNRTVSISKLRLDGCMRAYDEAGLAWDTVNIVECRKNDFNSGYKAVMNELSNGNKPDAIMAINDIMALGAMKALKELNLKIPEDISVAGYDDLIFSSISDISLTTVRQDIAEISHETVQLLLDRIKGKDLIPRTRFVQPELIIRHSTGVRTE
ncbi:LacI family transcriptional regulator [Paenibacillus psychroresistens]|uniref:LacI family transcriptional regulator n=1 Tax=Paenibacillus psychroresistens TaxID=1778678 RepID=A0A6B8RS19_9BACL|nr:LacI family DNA-binding transcriptional regulator [Paenibacillus psychroresistens]QGQ98749.1 LacI family transcriptional regulator [Paenibacillus psychroresistens]